MLPSAANIQQGIEHGYSNIREVLGLPNYFEYWLWLPEYFESDGMCAISADAGLMLKRTSHFVDVVWY